MRKSCNRILAVAGNIYPKAYLWNIRAGKVWRELNNGIDAFGDPAFSPNGQLVAAQGYQPHWQLPPDRPLPPGVELPSKDEDTHTPQDILVWDVKTGKRLYALHTYQGIAPAPVFLSDSRHIMDYNASNLWTLNGRFTYAKSFYTSGSLLPLRRNVAVTLMLNGSAQTRIILIHLDTDKRQYIKKHFYTASHPLSSEFSSNGNRLILGNEIWSLTSGNLIRILPAGENNAIPDVHTHNKLAQAMAKVNGFLDDGLFSPDSHYFAEGVGKPLGQDPQDPPSVDVWNVKSGQLLMSEVSHGSDPGPYAFSPDNRLIAIVDNVSSAIHPRKLSDLSTQNTITIYNIATGAVQQVIHMGEKNIANLSYVHQNLLGIHYSSQARSGKLMLLNTKSLKRAWTLKKINKIFSRTGNMIIANGGHVFQMSSGKLIATLVCLQMDSKKKPIWIIYLPSGYYCASINVGPVIRWRVGDRLYPASRFATRFDRPDLVRKALMSR